MNKTIKWVDASVMIASLVTIGISVVWMASGGVFDVVLTQDAKLGWHLVRSAGIVAYLLLTASTIWGLFMSSQLVKDWSPGPVSMTLHSTLSWLALALGLAHGLLLLFDDYFTYMLSDILVPFTGPYRPEVVGIGTLAFWLIIAITLSFPLKKRIGHQAWKRLHYASYAAFGLVSLHGLFAGTDGTHLGFRLLVAVGLLLVVVLLFVRISKAHVQPSTKPRNVPSAESVK